MKLTYMCSRYTINTDTQDVTLPEIKFYFCTDVYEGKI